MGYAREGDSLDEVLVHSGEFKTGNAAIKYLRATAQRKFEPSDWIVLADTLSSLQDRTANSLVPSCYGDASRHGQDQEAHKKCADCPYRVSCRTSPPLQKNEPQEDDSTFVARLQAKIKAKYGDHQ